MFEFKIGGKRGFDLKKQRVASKFTSPPSGCHTVKGPSTALMVKNIHQFLFYTPYFQKNMATENRCGAKY
jgi:hypothetical protein